MIDLTPDPCAAIETAGAAGYEFVLSSGGAPRAVDGAALLARMVVAAAGRLSVIAGAGVTPDNVAALVRATGVGQVHASASGTDEWRDPRIQAFGFATGPRRTTSADRVARLRTALLDG